MECDVRSSGSSSPDIFFNNFLDEEIEDSEYELPDLKSVNKHQHADSQCIVDSHETNGSLSCEIDTTLSFPVGGNVDMFSKSSGESTPIAVNSTASTPDATVDPQNDIQGIKVICEKPVDSNRTLFSDHGDEITSSSTESQSFEGHSMNDYDAVIRNKMDVNNMDASPTQKESSNSFNLTDLIHVETAHEKETVGNDDCKQLSSALEDIVNDAVNAEEEAVESEGEIECHIDSAANSLSLLECTCAKHGIKTAFTQELGTGIDDYEEKNLADTAITNKEDIPHLQKYMVGLIGGCVDDKIYGGSIAERKRERLQTRLPRIYHTRGSDELSERYGLRTKRMESKMPKTPIMILSSYAKERNCSLATVMENAENLRLTVQFPCMQCYDQHGKSAMYESVMQSLYGSTGSSSANNKCARCGAEKMNMVTFCKMLLRLKKTFKELGLIVRDVSSDGNCLFAAIVDQLRVQGDFRYTQENLRFAAVDYLRTNPTADDGTPYAMFLSDETWEQYLHKMSQDGEWGDHIVLRSISDLLNKKIVIYGGRTGEGLTEIVPKGGHDENITNHEAQIDYTVDELEANCKTDIHETEMESEKADKKDDVDDGRAKHDKTCLYIGHIGESHYVSLRRKDWRETLEKELKTQLLMRKNRLSPSKVTEEDEFCPGAGSISLQPLNHLNLMVKQVLQGDYIRSLNAETAERIESYLETNMAVSSLIGDQINKLSPYVVPVECILKTSSELFSDDSTEDFNMKEKNKKAELDTMIFVITKDSKVVDSFDDGGKFDLVLEHVSGFHGMVRLQPIDPSVWKGRTTRIENKVYLDAFSIDIMAPNSIGKKTSILAFHSHWPDKASEWRKRQRLSGWPDSRTVESVVNEGVNVVPVAMVERPERLNDLDVFQSGKDDRSVWLVSFAAAEKEIVRFLPDSARACFFLFKLLVDVSVKEHGGIPGNCLQHLFFYACEELGVEKWKKEPGTCLMYLLHRLMIGLKTKLPHYFIPQKNLFFQTISYDKITGLIRSIELLCSQPLLGIFLLMDEYELDISELGPLMDDILEDISRYNHHKDTFRSTEEAFVPGLYCLVQDYVFQGDYEHAMKTVYELLEVLGMPDTNDCIVSIISIIHSSQYVGYAWCLALYIELSKNRTGITRKICEMYSTVPISEIFGPEIVEEFGNTHVPKCFSIPYGQLEFPLEVAQVLDLSGNTNLLSKCLRYYAETFHDMFGLGPFPCKASGRICKTGCYCSLSKSIQLQDLYLRLFTCYAQMGKPKEFRELVPNFRQLVETTRMPSSYKNLMTVLMGVGDSAKASEVEGHLNAVNSDYYGDSFEDFYSVLQTS